MQDEFIGFQLGIGNHLQVIGWDGSRTKGLAKIYTVMCSVCAKDPELFGEGLFKSVKQSLVNGIIPCGCSVGPKWTEAQNIVRIERMCEKRNYKFIGFHGEYKGWNTYLSLKCLKDGCVWSTNTVHGLLSGKGCQVCSNMWRRSQNQREDQIGRELKGSKYTFVGWEDGYKNGNSFALIDCPQHGVFKMRTHTLVNRKGRCAKCSLTGFKASLPAHVYLLHIASEKSSFLGYGISNYVNKRLSHHRNVLAKKGFEIKSSEVFFFPSGQTALDIENTIKNKFVNSQQNIKSFKTESTFVENYQEIKCLIESFTT